MSTMMTLALAVAVIISSSNADDDNTSYDGDTVIGDDNNNINMVVVNGLSAWEMRLGPISYGHQRGLQKIMMNSRCLQ